MLISERIYQLLAEKGMSQKEFVEKTGISQSTVSDWRRKGTNPSADKILIICEVLDVSPYALLAGGEECNTIDYVIIDRNSKEYSLIECYRALSSDQKERVEGYLNALHELR